MKCVDSDESMLFQGAVETPGYDTSHPPANTPGGMSDGGPRSNYSERPNTPNPVVRQEEEEEEEVRSLSSFGRHFSYLRLSHPEWLDVS